MAFTMLNSDIGVVDLRTVDATGPGPFSLIGTNSGKMGRDNFMGETVRGYDPVLGGGEFVYARSNSTITVGQVCSLTFSQDSNNNMVITAAAWTGAANAQAILCVAISAPIATQYAWFQVSGNAIANVSGSVAANASVYGTASAGVVSTSVVVGQAIWGAKSATANGAVLGPTGTSQVTLASTQAVIFLNRPISEGVVT